jgi:hypothetical protein
LSLSASGLVSRIAFSRNASAAISVFGAAMPVNRIGDETPTTGDKNPPPPAEPERE